MWLLLVELFASLLVVAPVYHYYGSLWKRAWYVTFFTLLGWVISFYIVFLLPDDLMLSDYEACKSTKDSGCDQPLGLPSKDTLVTIWRIVFWLCFFLTWLIFPIIQEYSMAGDFTFIEKFRTAVKENIRLYAVAGTILGILLLVIIIKNNLGITSIGGIAIAAGNAWGLLCVVLLLGYGLVQIPRDLWRRSNQSIMLKHYQYKLVSYHHSKEEANEELLQVLQHVKKYEQVTPKTDPFYKYVAVTVHECPPEYSQVQADGDVSQISYKRMVSLHKRLMFAMERAQQRQVLYDNIVKKALRLEDIISSRNNPRRTINWFDRSPRNYRLGNVVDTMEFYWHVYLEQRLYQLLALICAILSGVVLWSETTLFIKKGGISLIGLVINSGVEGFWLQVFTVLPLMYICLCTYSSLFKIRLFNYFHIIPHHQTSANSLLFSASYLCRLITPLAYNFFLLVAQADGHSAYVEVMGSMDTAFGTALMGTSLSLVLPMLTMIVSASVLFNFYDKLLEKCNVGRFQFSEHFSDENVEMGAHMLSNERNKRKVEETTLRSVHVIEKYQSSPDEAYNIPRSPKSSFNHQEDIVQARFPTKHIFSRGKLENDYGSSKRSSGTSLFSDDLEMRALRNPPTDPEANPWMLDSDEEDSW